MYGETTKIEYSETNVTPSYGGKKIEVIYTITHTKNAHINQYRVKCELIGLQSADPHLHSQSAEFIGDNTNDETLTSDGAVDLFDTNFC